MRPRTALAPLAAALVVLLVWLARERSRLGDTPPAPATSAASAAKAVAASETAAITPDLPAASVAATVSASPPQIPVVEGTGGAATLADVTIAVRAAIKTEARRCNPGKPITKAIAHLRVVFYFTQSVSSGKVSLLDVVKIDSDLDDDRLERCLLNRVADVRLSAPGASDSSARLQETLDLGDLGDVAP